MGTWNVGRIKGNEEEFDLNFNKSRTKNTTKDTKSKAKSLRRLKWIKLIKIGEQESDHHQEYHVRCTKYLKIDSALKSIF